MENPWNLPLGEGQALTQIAETGCSKLAGRKLGISQKTVDCYVQRAMKRMGTVHRMRAVVMWDRWMNGHMTPLLLPEISEQERERLNMVLLGNVGKHLWRKAA